MDGKVLLEKMELIDPAYIAAAEEMTAPKGEGEILLEKMELIDPAYIDAADRMPERLPVPKHNFAFLAACILIAVVSGAMMLVSPAEMTRITETGAASVFGGDVRMAVFAVSLLAAAADCGIIYKKTRRK